MPFPVGAAIAAGATIASNAGTAYAQGKQNRKTRKWNEKMHALVREESLSDWAMQNEYNSPRAQMERYRDAGLNPNLIYGQTNEAPAVRSSEVQSWNPRAPQFNLDAPSVLSAYYDTQLKEASVDNLRTQNTVLVQEAILKAAQTASTLQSTSRSQFEQSIAESLKNTTIETAEANLRKLITSVDIDLQANERAAISNAASVSEAVERILSLRQGRAKSEDERRAIQQATINAKKDEQLKQLDIDLKKNGVQPGDNILFRVVARYLESIMSDSKPDREQILEDIRRKKLAKPHPYDFRNLPPLKK